MPEHVVIRTISYSTLKVKNPLWKRKRGCLKIKSNLLRNEYWDMFSDRYPNKKRVKSHCDTPSYVLDRMRLHIRNQLIFRNQ